MSLEANLGDDVASFSSPTGNVVAMGNCAAVYFIHSSTRSHSGDSPLRREVCGGHDHVVDALHQHRDLPTAGGFEQPLQHLQRLL